jgi:hypothetical protein
MSFSPFVYLDGGGTLIDCGLGFTGVVFGAGGMGFGGGGGGVLGTFFVVSGNLLVVFWLSLAHAVPSRKQNNTSRPILGFQNLVIVIPHESDLFLSERACR